MTFTFFKRLLHKWQLGLFIDCKQIKTHSIRSGGLFIPHFLQVGVTSKYSISTNQYISSLFIILKLLNFPPFQTGYKRTWNMRNVSSVK